MSVVEFRPFGDEHDKLKKLLNTYREHFVSLDWLESLPDPEWLIDGILMKESTAVLWGDPKVGKSFVMLDMALSIACDRPWFGHDVKPGNVVYVVGEGVRGVWRRAQAWMTQHQLQPEDESFMVLKKTVKLLEDFVPEMVVQLCKEQSGANKQPTNLVVIDTLARAVSGQNANDGVVMSKLVEAADFIKEETGACVLFVHHGNKSAQKTMRGASELGGAIDTEIEVEHLAGEPFRTIMCRSQKDAKPFSDVRFLLKDVGDSVVPAKDYARDNFEAL